MTVSDGISYVSILVAAKVWKNMDQFQYVQKFCIVSFDPKSMYPQKVAQKDILILKEPFEITRTGIYDWIDAPRDYNLNVLENNFGQKQSVKMTNINPETTDNLEVNFNGLSVRSPIEEKRHLNKMERFEDKQ